MEQNVDSQAVDDGFDGLDYAYAPSPPMLDGIVIRGERELWCAVIAQAFADLGMFAARAPSARTLPMPGENQLFDAAARWLLHDNRHFPHICELAGVSPKVIRHAAYVFYGQCLLAADVDACHSTDKLIRLSSPRK